jgi:hypothetical protein
MEPDSLETTLADGKGFRRSNNPTQDEGEPPRYLHPVEDVESSTRSWIPSSQGKYTKSNREVRYGTTQPTCLLIGPYHIDLGARTKVLMEHQRWTRSLRVFEFPFGNCNETLKGG